jgi:hypothetical protein
VQGNSKGIRFNGMIGTKLPGAPAVFLSGEKNGDIDGCLYSQLGKLQQLMVDDMHLSALFRKAADAADGSYAVPEKVVREDAQQFASEKDRKIKTPDPFQQRIRRGGGLAVQIRHALPVNGGYGVGIEPPFDQPQDIGVSPDLDGAAGICVPEGADGGQAQNKITKSSLVNDEDVHDDFLIR